MISTTNILGWGGGETVARGGQYSPAHNMEPRQCRGGGVQGGGGGAKLWNMEPRQCSTAIQCVVFFRLYFQINNTL